MSNTIHLLPELAQFLDEKIRSGEFADADELVNEALREKADRDHAYKTWAHAHIADALAEVRAGDAKYASLEMVTEWVTSWGTEDEQPKPLCK